MTDCIARAGAIIVGGGGVLKGRRLDSLNLDELKHLSKRGAGNSTDGPITKAFALAKIGLAELGSRLPGADSGADALFGLDENEAPVVQVDNQPPKEDDTKACDILAIRPRKAKPNAQHRFTWANCSTYFGFSVEGWKWVTSTNSWSVVGVIRTAILFYILCLCYPPLACYPGMLLGTMLTAVYNRMTMSTTSSGSQLERFLRA
jgi:hypothetical protein